MNGHQVSEPAPSDPVRTDPIAGGYRAYDASRYTGPGTTGYVSPPGTVAEAQEARRAYVMFGVVR